jgi:hypothetical protein
VSRQLLEFDEAQERHADVFITTTDDRSRAARRR